MKLINKRRRFLRDALALTGAVALGGCDKLSQTDWAPKVLGGATALSHAAQRAFGRVVVDLDAAIVAVARQRRPAHQHVADGLG